MVPDRESLRNNIVAEDSIAARRSNLPASAMHKTAGKWWRLAPICLLLTGLLLSYALGAFENLTLQELAENGAELKLRAADNAVLAALAFIAFYALTVAMSFPAVALLKVIGGFLFGWLAGTVYIIVAATVGAALLFLSVRTALGGFLRNSAGKGAAKLAREFERDAFSYMLMMRLAPFIPFAVASIAPALFGVRLRSYLAATTIGTVPGAICFAWAGQGIDMVIEDARAAGRPFTLSELITPEITIALLVLALVVVLAPIVRKVRGPQAH